MALSVFLLCRHENGDGFNVILQALPLQGNGKLVVRAYDQDQLGSNTIP